MFSPFRNFCERLLRIPPAPESPPGDEASTRVFNAAPNFYKYLLFMWAVKSAFFVFILSWFAIGPAVGAFALAKKGHREGLLLLLIPGIIGLLLVLGRLFALAVLRLDFEKRWYVVTDRSLRVREGIIGVREMTVTFANIQNISISQGPIQRALGIADLRVDTAGGGSVQQGKHPGQNLHTAWFRGVNNASEVRELIQQRLREFKDAGLGDLGDFGAPISKSARNELAHARADLETGAPNDALLGALRDLHAEAAALCETVARTTLTPVRTTR
jgi:membrane protein YdbS with pleckstrin-like domain